MWERVTRKPNKKSTHNSRRETPMKSRIMPVAACVAAALLTGLPGAQSAKLEGPNRQDRVPRTAHR